jgi:integrase/recombinase XerD
VLRYLAEVRTDHLRDASENAMFLGVRGAALTPGWITELVKSRMVEAGIEQPGGAHVLRHSVATSMLENGADVRVIQEFLGHKHLSTTQIYTKVSIAKLKEVHAKTHPARMRRGDGASEEASDID